jgi:hypothetical protein
VRLSGRHAHRASCLKETACPAERPRPSFLIRRVGGRTASANKRAPEEYPVSCAVALARQKIRRRANPPHSLTAGWNERHAHIFELRCFAGLTTAEAAPVLGVSERTIRDERRPARPLYFAPFAPFPPAHAAHRPHTPLVRDSCLAPTKTGIPSRALILPRPRARRPAKSALPAAPLFRRLMAGR